MLWLVIGIVLLVIAIAGGSIVHPILFALGVLALVVFLVGYRGRGRRGRGRAAARPRPRGHLNLAAVAPPG